MIFGDPRLPDRFWNKVIPVTESGCWLWLGALPTGPQIRWKVDGVHKSRSAKRVAYEAVHGPQSAEAIGGCIDACVQPDHMIAATGAAISSHVAAKRAKSVTCRKGHPWAVVGYYISYSNEGREVHHCRACHAAVVARYADRARRRRIYAMTPERRAEFLQVGARQRRAYEDRNGPSLRTLYFPQGVLL